MPTNPEKLEPKSERKKSREEIRNTVDKNTFLGKEVERHKKIAEKPKYKEKPEEYSSVLKQVNSFIEKGESKINEIVDSYFESPDSLKDKLINCDQRREETITKLESRDENIKGENVINYRRELQDLRDEKEVIETIKKISEEEKNTENAEKLFRGKEEELEKQKKESEARKALEKLEKKKKDMGIKIDDYGEIEEITGKEKESEEEELEKAREEAGKAFEEEKE